MKAIEITSIPHAELAQYGKLLNLKDCNQDNEQVVVTNGDGFLDITTTSPIIDTVGSLGRTIGSPMPFVLQEMERHLHGEEALLPIADPICLCMAPASEHAPMAKDTIAAILRPGYVFVLHRGTWHSPAHGLTPDSPYYWLSWTYPGEPTVWNDVEDGPVHVEL